MRIWAEKGVIYLRHQLLSTGLSEERQLWSRGGRLSERETKVKGGAREKIGGSDGGRKSEGGHEEEEK